MAYTGVLANHQVVLGTGTSSLNVVSGTGTTGEVLTSQGSGSDPIWSAVPGTGTITAVGDVTSGNAFDGTQGTTLTATNVGMTLGAADASGTNVAGGPLNLNVGLHTGNATPSVATINGSRYSTSSSSGVSLLIPRILTNCVEKSLSSATPVNVCSFGLSPLIPLTASGTIFYQLEAQDANTDCQVCMGQINFTAACGSVSLVGQVSSPYSEISSVTTGSISTSWSFSSTGYNATIVCTPTSTGLASLDHLQLYYTIITNAQVIVSVDI
jgi:hypothetical protein